MAESIPQQPTSPKIEPIAPPEGVYGLYSNHAGVGAGASDVRIFFGELADATPEKVRVFQRAVVTMSWLQAKVLARLIQDYVDAYEKLNGPIQPPKLPPQVIQTNAFQPK